jgi:hypothetical protein
MKKVIVLRNVNTFTWHFIREKPSEFKPNSFKGYRMYRSFNNLMEARAYAKNIEQNEKEHHHLTV